jgi:uncharacterized protein YecT (DUF1311 family)
MKRSIFVAVLVLQSQLDAQMQGALQEKAKTALQSQISQIGKDCPDAKTAIEENTCVLAVGKRTDADFRTFYESLRALLSSNTEAVNRLDASQQLWVAYRQKSCEGVEAVTGGGTNHFSSSERCRIQLMRSRMADLNALYDTTLHH